MIQQALIPTDRQQREIVKLVLDGLEMNYDKIYG